MPAPVNAYADLHSGEVQEILGARPSWVVSWGISVIALAVAAACAVAWFVRYPDLARAPVVITSGAAPVRVLARTGGRVSLFATENSRVAPGDVLGVVENPARYEDVRRLKDALAAKQFDEALFAAPLVLGDLEPEYSRFVNAWSLHRSLTSGDYRERKTAELRNQIAVREEIVRRQRAQIALSSDEVRLLESQYQRSESLHAQQLLSPSDLDKARSAILTARQALQKEQSATLVNEVQLADDRRALIDHLHSGGQSALEAELEVGEARRRLQAVIRAWEQQYALVAPQAGEVSFFKVWRSGEVVGAGEEVLTIVPARGGVVAKAFLPQLRAGKVRTGQTVLLRLDDYPHEEFGIVRGVVASIAPIAREQQYAVTIALPHGLTSSYGNALAFKPELRGIAEIVTNDRSLLERLFDQIRGAVRR